MNATAPRTTIVAGSIVARDLDKFSANAIIAPAARASASPSSPSGPTRETALRAFRIYSMIRTSRLTPTLMAARRKLVPVLNHAGKLHGGSDDSDDSGH